MVPGCIASNLGEATQIMAPLGGQLLCLTGMFPCVSTYRLTDFLSRYMLVNGPSFGKSLRMHLCDFGADLDMCKGPDADFQPRCTGPGGHFVMPQPPDVLALF